MGTSKSSVHVLYLPCRSRNFVCPLFKFFLLLLLFLLFFFYRCLSPLSFHKNASSTSVTHISVLCPALCLGCFCMREKFLLNDDLDVKPKRKYIVFYCWRGIFQNIWQCGIVGGAYFRVPSGVSAPAMVSHWLPPLQPLSLYRRHCEEDVECDEIESKSHINCSPIVFWGKKCFYFLLCDNLWSLSALCAVVYHSSQSNPTLTLNPPTMNYKNDQFGKENYKREM